MFAHQTQSLLTGKVTHGCLVQILSEVKKPIAVNHDGPWGGQGGSPWDDGVFTNVREITIVSSAAIDSIRFQYDRHGRPHLAEKHGGNGGNITDKITLDFRNNEYLISISGHYGTLTHGHPPVIRSLTFQSNMRKYGPYGVEQGTYFSRSSNGDKIVGFHGKSGWFLDSIGVHFHSPSSQTFWSTIKGNAKSICLKPCCH
eukprot:Gb_22485 [translate_table: standard]